ncbi:5088_t:CDS:2, partial [Funneliformis caledonium]
QLKEEEKHVQIKQNNKEFEDKYKDSVNVFQQPKKETNEILVELANYEKEDINLEERKKHTIFKQKKVTITTFTDRYRFYELENIFRDSRKRT